jgi:hypothetical protein
MMALLTLGQPARFACCRPDRDRDNSSKTVAPRMQMRPAQDAILANATTRFSAPIAPRSGATPNRQWTDP